MTCGKGGCGGAGGTGVLEAHMEVSLEYHELRRIAEYVGIAARKGDGLPHRLRSLVKGMEDAAATGRHSVSCRIVVEAREA